MVGSTKIVLENSHFIATETALLVNIPSTVNIENCEFSGNHQAAFCVEELIRLRILHLR